MKPQSAYKPEFEVHESYIMGIGDKRVNQKINLTVSWKVIERTKNYIVLAINGINLVKTARSF